LKGGDGDIPESIDWQKEKAKQTERSENLSYFLRKQGRGKEREKGREREREKAHSLLWNPSEAKVTAKEVERFRCLKYILTP
jgi:hypothetical protein